MGSLRHVRWSPPIRGLVTWNSESRLAVISSTRGGERFGRSCGERPNQVGDGCPLAGGCRDSRSTTSRGPP